MSVEEELAEAKAEIVRLESYVRSVEEDCVVLMNRYAAEHNALETGEGYAALLHAGELLAKYEGRDPPSPVQMKQWRLAWLTSRLDEVVRLIERIKQELP